MINFYGAISSLNLCENKNNFDRKWKDHKCNIFAYRSKDKDIFDDKDILLIFQGNLFDNNSNKKNSHYIFDLYIKHKNLDFIKNLNGSFNLLIWNRIENKLYLATDKCGSRPLYSYLKNNIFIFGNRISQICQFLNKNLNINWKAWGQYLTFRFTLGENTFYKDITYISNGTIYEINYNHGLDVQVKRYWDFSEIEIDNIRSFDQKVSQGAEIFKNVFSNLASKLDNQKNIIALSGGFDSRSIVSGLVKFSNFKNFDTVTTLHPCGSEKEIVEDICNHLKIKNIYINRPNNLYKKYFIQKVFLCEGLVQEHLWSMPMSDLVKKYDVYVDGMAGDIIMRSTRVRPVHVENCSDVTLLSKLFKKQFGFEYHWLINYLANDDWEKIKYSDDWAKDEFLKIPTTEYRMSVFLMKNRVRNGISIAPNNIMGSFIDSVIFPFINNNLVDFGFSIPHDYKFKFIYRKIIDYCYPEIREIKSTSDENLEKLTLYDQRIMQFEQNPRELIADYSEISKEDVKYLNDLLEKIEFPPFIDKQSFLRDIHNDFKIQRAITLLDISLWYSFFVNNNRIENFY